MSRSISVLVGCEESGTVRDAFRERGHFAWSCDTESSRGKFTEYHIKDDIMTTLRVYPRFDLVILFPDCTKMATSGNRRYAGTQARRDAVAWTLELWYRACEKSDCVVLENPNSVIWPAIRPYCDDIQFIEPWMFGHMEKKRTGLALKGVPRLQATHFPSRSERAAIPKEDMSRIGRMGPSSTRKRDRAKTYEGVARAMSLQWGDKNIFRVANGYPQRA